MKILCLVACLTLFSGCGLQNPVNRDSQVAPGESTPQEDEIAIALYTQTVNQALSSTTDIDITAGGDVFVVTGSGTVTYRPIRYAPPTETETAP